MDQNYYDLYQRHPLFSDEFFGQFLRTLGKCYAQCADVGECYAVLAKIKDNDFNSWYDSWQDMAKYLEDIGSSCLAKKHRISAGYSFLRATEYYRASEFFLRARSNDSRIIHAFDKVRACFERSLDCLHTNWHKATIPFDNTFLEGYLFLTDLSKATLVVPGGYDSTVEELYPLVTQALNHGYSILIFDGPGQGQVLRRRKIYMRPDFEHVIKQVLDWLDVYPKMNRQYVLVGRSFGGYLAPRAACFDNRLKALIADPGQIDIAGSISRIIPEMIYSSLKMGDRNSVNSYFERLFASDMMKAFYFKSRMAVHGISNPFDYLTEMNRYQFVDEVANIRCPTLVCDNPSDRISNRGNSLYEALTCEKTYALFDAKRGAGMHCEADAHGQFFQVVFDWLDEKFCKIRRCPDEKAVRFSSSCESQ